MNNSLSRFIIGVLGIIILLLSNYISYTIFGILLLIILLLSGYELYNLLKPEGIYIFLYFIPLVLLFTIFFPTLLKAVGFLWILSIFLIMLLSKYKGSIILYSTYLIVPLILLFAIRKDFGDIKILILLVTVWALDVFSYFCGKLFGRKKIVPTISPNKTLEGTITGLVFSALIFLLLTKAYGILTWMHVFIAIILPLSGFYGDLFESYIKRKANVKDSSSLLMGHGGVLDRFDSLLFASVLYFFFLFI
jgi:phosphatidate cytidylyltransferase